ncbi:hypothetical protein DEO72_LG3g1675 [Vigna unguiculata]|uniref:Uncharacterized protein n=1 Tax=Vigna unguiculata TaxID=3917 RepID=A0A4D6LEV3_VIGUN|nr:hypothetical protein DEO72_LG3g1675 [Vigna unguiculata]
MRITCSSGVGCDSFLQQCHVGVIGAFGVVVAACSVAQLFVCDSKLCRCYGRGGRANEDGGRRRRSAVVAVFLVPGERRET